MIWSEETLCEILRQVKIATLNLYLLYIHIKLIYFSKVTNGLHVLHTRNFVHLDIKPENIYGNFFEKQNKKMFFFFVVDHFRFTFFFFYKVSLSDDERLVDANNNANNQDNNVSRPPSNETATSSTDPTSTYAFNNNSNNNKQQHTLDVSADIDRCTFKLGGKF